MRIVILDNNIVINIVDGTLDHLIMCGITAVASDTAQIGDVYKDGIFTTPPLPPPEPFVLSKIEFLKRFTKTEIITIRQAAKSSPELDVFLFLLDHTDSIHSDDPDTVAGLQSLEDCGLLCHGRTMEILS